MHRTIYGVVAVLLNLIDMQSNIPTNIKHQSFIKEIKGIHA